MDAGRRGKGIVGAHLMRVLLDDVSAEMPRMTKK
jgi:hypothetical protein